MINLDWVNDYVNISDIDALELAKLVTNKDINVEGVISKYIKNLVVGLVLEVKKHPNSDHLHLCKVDIGEEVLDIVCGAPNVREGIKVIVAKVGAVLPGGEIKSGVIRGEVSNGMLCALFELGLEEATDEVKKKGITELGEECVVGEDVFKYIGNDTLFELDIHKHRNNDCYYHIGFAYIVSAVLNRKINLPVISYNTINDNVNNYIKLEVKSSKCSYYVGRMVKDVKIGESPAFIKKRLESVGIRSINNVVDISNYVMLEYGQPLHFFDYDKLGNKVIVRDALDNEEVTTLDGVSRKLSSKDIVISNDKNIECIAGVMGGANSEISIDTKNIFIESAIFDPVSIRNTANRLDLRSEASIRYGKGLNYEYSEEASKRACQLLEKYASAKVLEGVVLYDNIDKKIKTVTFTGNQVSSMLGITISDKDIENELNRLQFEYKYENNKFIVIIPNRRLDIESNINDIAEEIGKLYGYDNLVSTLPRVIIKKGEYKGDVKYRKMISKRLRGYGLNEVKTYTLINPVDSFKFSYRNIDRIVLPNPLGSDKSVVRSSLINSLIGVYNYNRSRKVDDIFLYEISKVYDVNYNEDTLIAGLLEGNYIGNGINNFKTDFYLVKGIVEDLLRYMGFSNRYSFIPCDNSDMHPYMSAYITLDNEVIGIIGRVHPNVCKDDLYVFELSMNKLLKPVKNIKYVEAPKYPGVSRDVSFVVSKDVNAGDIKRVLNSSRIVNSVKLFDIYEGDKLSGKKALAYNILFQDNNKTLTTEEVNKEFDEIVNKVVNKYSAVVRDR